MPLVPDLLGSEDRQFFDTTTALAINNITPIQTTIGDLGLFNTQFISNTFVRLDEYTETCALLPLTERCGPLPTNTDERHRVRTIELVSTGKEMRLQCDEVQNRINATGDPMSWQDLATRRLNMIDRELELSEEWHRAQALLGYVSDPTRPADAPLYDYALELGRTRLEKTIDFGNDVDGNPLIDVPMSVQCCKRDIATNLGGSLASGYYALAGSLFWDNLINHASVKPIWERCICNDGRAAFIQEQANPRETLPLGGVTIERYPQDGAKGVNFVAPDQLVIFPLGVQGMFTTFYGPGSTFRQNNQLGQRRFITSHEGPHGECFEWKMRSHFLNVNTRPDAVCVLTGSNLTDFCG